MNANTLQAKALEAAATFLSRKGYEIVDPAWIIDDLGPEADGVIARDGDAIVFTEVTANPVENGGFAPEAERAKMEIAATRWLGENETGGDFPVRFDRIGLLVLNPDRALLRHHINAFSEA